MINLYVGRHGRAKEDGKRLSVEGYGDAVDMAERLQAQRFSRRSIIVSSVAERAVRTAVSIKNELKIPTLVQSEFISMAGLRPEPIKDVKALQNFVGGILEACGVDHTESDVLVVAHKPLVDAVTGIRQLEHYGDVHRVADNWENPKYRRGFEMLMQEPEDWKRNLTLT